jgi:hypothetical protein
MSASKRTAPQWQLPVYVFFIITLFDGLSAVRVPGTE